MEPDSEEPKNCCRRLKYFERKCISQQQKIDSLTKEVSYLQEKFEAQDTMLQQAFGYVQELEQKFKTFTTKG